MAKALLWLLPMMMFAASDALASVPVDAEYQARRAIFETVHVKLTTQDYAELNRIERDMRTTRSRTPSGNWQLAIFFDAIAFAIQESRPTGTCLAIDQRQLSRWIAADPNAPTPYIANAIALQQRGWCQRGYGFADTVTAAGAAAFQGSMADARAALEEHRDIAAVDPRFYEEMINIATAQHANANEVMALLEEGSNREPYYYNNYYSATKVFLPQWGGQRGDIERLARRMMERTQDDGAIGYFRVLRYVSGCDCLSPDEPVDMLLLRQSMAELIARNPTDHNARSSAYLACILGDAALSRQYFMLMSAELLAAERYAPEMQRCRAFAGV